CYSFFAKGSLSGKKVYRLGVELICGDTTTGGSWTCGVSGATGEATGQKITLDNQSYYSIKIGKCGGDTPQAKCQSHGYVKGFAILASISQTAMNSEYYIIDASSCGSNITKSISADNINNPVGINWLNVESNKLFANDNSNVCNLNITQNEFPNR
ncbi:MAG TPA: hypothetical protein DEO26_01255, partial [Candidatus Veblenbacteria bacterium]|nr:hypothetical protein [Candidatus Veblenbacteria bacterium]